MPSRIEPWRGHSYRRLALLGNYFAVFYETVYLAAASQFFPSSDFHFAFPAYRVDIQPPLRFPPRPIPATSLPGERTKRGTQRFWSFESQTGPIHLAVTVQFMPMVLVPSLPLPCIENLKFSELITSRRKTHVLLHCSVCALEAHLLLAAGHGQEGPSTRFLNIVELERFIEVFLFHTVPADYWLCAPRRVLFHHLLGFGALLGGILAIASRALGAMSGCRLISMVLGVSHSSDPSQNPHRSASPYSGTRCPSSSPELGPDRCNGI